MNSLLKKYKNWNFKSETREMLICIVKKCMLSYATSEDYDLYVLQVPLRLRLLNNGFMRIISNDFYECVCTPIYDIVQARIPQSFTQYSKDFQHILKELVGNASIYQSFHSIVKRSLSARESVLERYLHCERT